MKNKGITLIALVLTIIVLIILTGVSISMLIGENGIITKANIAKISTELSNYNEELNQWKLSKIMDDDNFIEDTLSAGKNNLSYDGFKQDGNIKTIIPDLNDKYIDELEIIKGQLVINTTEKSKIEASKIVNISVNPYIIVNGELKSAGTNLNLMSSNGTVTIPENVTKIGDGAFSGVDGLKTVVIPGNVKEIGANTFAYNQTLETVVLQDGIEKIGDKAFYKCENLSKISLPNTVTSIGSFSISMTKIKELTIPSSLKIIGKYSIYAAYALETVNISEGVEEIKSNAFESCSNLTIINLPSTINTVDANSFMNCNNLVQINVNNDKFVYISGMLLPQNRNQIIFLSKKSLENNDTLNIPDGITSFTIRLGNFTNIKKIYIPKSLTYMIEGALPNSIESIIVDEENKNFYVENKQLYMDTTLLKSYTMQEKVTVKEGTKTIGASAFCEEINAKEVVLADSVERINPYIINIKNSKLEKIKINSNVSNINSQFNFGALNVKMELDENNKNFKIIDNILYSYDKTKLICALYLVTGNLEIRNGTKEISSYAFYGQSELEGLILPDGIEKINDNIILRCGKIKSLEIPSSIKEINVEAFNEAGGLNEIIIHKKANEIKNAPWGAPKGERIIKWNEE